MTRRLIGDARESWLYDCRIDQWEAQQLADIEHRHNDLMNGTKPVVIYSGRRTERRYGSCRIATGEIRLNSMGENLGTLAHELAHLNYTGRRWHDQAFKECHLSILQSFEEYARERR